MKQSDIVSAIRSGRGEYIWVPLPGYSGIEVMSDALKLEGVRVAVSATTAQQCADLLGATLSTAELEDVIWKASDVNPTPCTFSPKQYNICADSTVAAHSKALDDQLQGVSGGTLIGNVGKAWVLDNGNRSGYCANYGYHTASGGVLQPLYFGHNRWHYDYSQTLRLVRGGPLPYVGGPLHKLRVDDIPREAPIRDTLPSPPPDGAEVPLQLRALRWCMDEAEFWRGEQVSKERISEYSAGARRRGLRVGYCAQFCAAAQGYAEHAVAAPGEATPPWRAAARELEYDARRGDRDARWVSQSEARKAGWEPPPGALAVYWRRSPGSGLGHVERVIQPRGQTFDTIGANEDGGYWVIETSTMAHERLLGFVCDSEELQEVLEPLPEPAPELQEYTLSASEKREVESLIARTVANMVRERHE